MAIDIDRRASARTPIARPVYLENAKGFTHNLSASGVFFWITSGSYNVGDPISLSLEISGPEGPVMVKCRGVIVRVERYESRLGVAVNFTETETRLPYLPWISGVAKWGEGAKQADQSLNRLSSHAPFRRGKSAST